jgi:hypothetical protein
LSERGLGSRTEKLSDGHHALQEAVTVDHQYELNARGSFGSKTREHAGHRFLGSSARSTLHNVRGDDFTVRHAAI